MSLLDSIVNRTFFGLLTTPARGSKKRRVPAAELHVEPVVHDVPVPHHVLLALQAELARLLARLLAAELDEVGVGGDLGPDEAPLDVRVDLAGGLDGDGAAADLPGADLVLADGEEADRVEQAPRRLDEAVLGAALQAEVLEEGGLVVRVGSRMIDASLKSKLQRLQLAMKGAQ